MPRVHLRRRSNYTIVVKNRAAAAVFPIFVLAAPLAFSASFDCSLAQSKHEKLVCSDPNLSHADDRVGEIYQTDLARLPKQWRPMFKQNQLQWLKSLRDALARIKPDQDAEAMQYLSHEYDQRTTKLEHWFTTLDNLTFFAVEISCRHSSSDEQDHQPIINHLYYPQILDPKNENDVGFNKNIVRYDPCHPTDDDEHDHSISIEYKNLSVSKDAISVSFSSDDYVHGAAHGYAVQEKMIWLRSGRQLRESDIFDDKSAWRPALANLVGEVLIQKDYWHGDPKNLEPYMAVDHLDISEDGLHVRFLPYEVGGYMSTPQVTIPWEQLSPYLTKSPDLHLPPYPAISAPAP